MARTKGGGRQAVGSAFRPARGGPLGPVLALVLGGALWSPLQAVAKAAVTAPAAAPTEHGALGQAVLHVPSPDWRDQVLYFVMTDRFDDGEPANDDQHAGEFDPADPAKYNGGDFAGIARHLDYICGLGATGVWVTPPVLNRWWDPVAHHGGYHGYWAKDFSRVDPHLGTLADYQALSRRLHGAGLVLVQDIVLNHTADYFEYDAGWDAKDPAAHVAFSPDSVGDSAPTQAPFDRNDPRKPGDRAAGIYHWTPKVRDFQDAAQTLDWQMGGLDDLASENPSVRRALRRSYGDWIVRAGVDGFRIDTALYVPNDALDDFLYSRDHDAPGVLAVAAGTGRDAFHVFGEGFAIDKPYEDVQARRIDALMRRADGSTLLPGMLNFPLYGDIGAVFARGAPPAQLAWRIEDMLRVHAHPELMPSFVDNHDVDRFLAGGDEAGLAQALLLLFTLPGIPTIYYGTEQGLRGQRAAMFAAGSGSGGRDHFDVETPMYRTIARLAALRRTHRLFSRGRPTVLQGSAAGAGVLAYRMVEGEASALVVFNTADAPMLADNLAIGSPGARLEPVFALAGEAPSLRADAGGRVSLQVPAHGGMAWRIVADAAADAAAAAARAPGDAVAGAPGAPTLDSKAMMRADGSFDVRGDFEVGGTAPGVGEVWLVVDGDLAHARAAPVRRGHWRARVDTSAMVDPAVPHRLVAWTGASARASAARLFRVERPWQLLAEADDPAGDDTGPAGRYRYPTDWTTRTLDLRHLRVEGAGGALRITLTMAATSTLWNPPNGFDHLAVNVYVALPGKAAEAVAVAAMPAQNDVLPGGLRWNRRLRVHGWSNALFSSVGAGPAADGTPAVPAAAIAVHRASNTVQFTLAPGALGGASLSGARVYVTTWDYDGGYRPLRAQAAGSLFGGGDGARDPLWMDASPVLRLP
jgi:glycosidase